MTQINIVKLAKRLIKPTVEQKALIITDQISGELRKFNNANGTIFLADINSSIQRYAFDGKNRISLSIHITCESIDLNFATILNKKYGFDFGFMYNDKIVLSLSIRKVVN